jgi:hypothetical protein
MQKFLWLKLCKTDDNTHERNVDIDQLNTIEYKQAYDSINTDQLIEIVKQVSYTAQDGIRKDE